MMRCKHGGVIDGAYQCPDCTAPAWQNSLSAEERLRRWLQWWDSVMQPLGVGASDDSMREWLAEKFITQQPGDVDAR